MGYVAMWHVSQSSTSLTLLILLGTTLNGGSKWDVHRARDWRKSVGLYGDPWNETILAPGNPWNWRRRVSSAMRSQAYVTFD